MLRNLDDPLQLHLSVVVGFALQQSLQAFFVGLDYSVNCGLTTSCPNIP
jgi:hypothetical protein